MLRWLRVRYLESTRKAASHLGGLFSLLAVFIVAELAGKQANSQIVFEVWNQ
jgi:hypothetical protein